MSEATFLSIYGSPVLQAAVGIDPKKDSKRHASKSTLHHQLVQERIAELKARIPEGGIREAVVRALLYVAMTRGAADERGFEAIRRIRSTQKDLKPLPLADFKALVRDQYFMLLIDSPAAVAALHSMLPNEPELRTKAFELIKQVIEVGGALPPEGQTRLQEIATLFGCDQEAALVPALDTKGNSTQPKSVRSDARRS